MSACKRCEEQGQPRHFGSAVKCAFESGAFCSDNWQCATALRLRELLPPGSIHYSEDCYAAIAPTGSVDAGFLLVQWYKRRGRTSSIDWILEDEPPHPATLEEVELAILALEDAEGGR